MILLDLDVPCDDDTYGSGIFLQHHNQMPVGHSVPIPPVAQVS